MLHNDRTHNYYSTENISQGHNSSRENIHSNYENVEIRNGADENFRKCTSPYENVHLIQVPPNVCHSPRTRIKTIVPSNRDQGFTCGSSPKDAAEVIENKFAILDTEQYLLQNPPKGKNFKNENSQVSLVQNSQKTEPAKFIFPLEEPPENQNSNPPNLAQRIKKSESNEKVKVDKLRTRKKDLTSRMSLLKRQIAEIEIQEDELQREIELEHALIMGEHQSKLLDLDKANVKKEKLQNYAQKIEDKMHHGQAKQEKDQKQCKTKLKQAQEEMAKMEEQLSNTVKTEPGYEAVFEEYLKAQELLDNERKAFEDLEFHHLEEEADWLASREEVQREILELSKTIDSIKEQLDDLDQQKYYTSKNNNSEFKVLKKRRLECMLQLEKLSNHLKHVDNDLAIFANQDSEPDESSDTDSDKSKDLEKQLSNLSLNLVHDMSCSVIVSKSKTSFDQIYNMSQSFNEDMLQEKNILESGLGKYPSQDDIDRISKVTSNAPINFDEEQSLGRKTIESLKDIERRRQLHLHQQGRFLIVLYVFYSIVLMLGSHVIEHERQRVQALKQRVQEEAKSEWAQRRQDFSSVELSETETSR